MISPMKVKIHELAALEFDEAARWYDIQSSGLGKRFKNTVLAQIRKIRQTPDWFLVEEDDQKFAIIDQRVVWYGSINLLSYGSAQESMMRIESSNVAIALLKSIKRS